MSARFEGCIDFARLYPVLRSWWTLDLLWRRFGQLANLLCFSSEFDAVLSLYDGVEAELAECVVGHSRASARAGSTWFVLVV